MKKRLEIILPGGEWYEHEEGRENVSSIRCLNHNLVSVMYEYMDGECKVVKETVYSGMPFILTDV